MTRLLPFLLLLFAVPGPTGAASIYRCEGPNGPTYADRPCGNGAEPVAPRPLTVVAAVEASRAPIARSAARLPAVRRGPDADAIRRAMIRDRAAPGMSLAQLRFTLGEPDRVRVHATGARRSETWTFERHGQRHRVRIVGGRVAGASTTSGRSRR